MKGYRCLTLLLLVLFGTAAQAEAPLTLRQSIEIALKRNPTLQAAKAAIQEAEYRRREALSAFLPRVETRYSYSRLDEAPTMPGFTLETPLGPVSVPPQKVGSRDNYLWSTTITQPLFTGGALRGNYHIAKLGLEAARWELECVKRRLILKVKELYYGVLVAERTVEVAKGVLKALKEHYRVAEAFYREGMVPRNDLLQVEVELAQREQDLVCARRALQQARAAFNTLLRRDLEAEVRLADGLRQEPFQGELQECIERAFRQRPEIRAAQLQLQMAKGEVRVAASKLLPQLSLLFSYERQGDEPSVSGSRYRPDEDSWNITLLLQWQLWDWGGTWWKVKERRARVLQAERRLEEVRDAVRLQVVEAFLSLQEARKRIKVTQKAIEQAEENLRMSRERYRAQVATSSEVLDALAMLSRAKSNHYRALSDYNLALARLQWAMGEGP